MSGCHSQSLCQFLLLLISPWRCPLLPKTADSEYYELFLTSQWWWCLVTKSCLTCDPMDCSLPCSTLSMGFPRREHWSGLPFPSPGDLPKTGIEPGLLALQADSLPTEPPVKPQLHNSEKQSGLFCGSLIPKEDWKKKKQTPSIMNLGLKVFFFSSLWYLLSNLI